MIVYWLYDDNCDDPKKHGYIGVTEEPSRRIRQHKRSKRFPKNGFNMKVLFEGSVEECLEKEQELRPTCFTGWNKAPGGGMPPSHKGKPKSLETRKRMSEGRKGMKFSDEHRANLRLARSKQIRRPMSAETKRRISIATTGSPKTLTKEQRQALSDRAALLHTYKA
jgi:hypothetical protein